MWLHGFVNKEDSNSDFLDPNLKLSSTGWPRFEYVISFDGLNVGFRTLLNIDSKVQLCCDFFLFPRNDKPHSDLSGSYWFHQEKESMGLALNHPESFPPFGMHPTSHMEAVSFLYTLAACEATAFVDHHICDPQSVGDLIFLGTSGLRQAFVGSLDG